MKLDYIPALRDERGRAGRVAIGIVIHTTVGTLAGAVSWFRDPASRVSAHYVVGLDGRVVQMVSEPDTAFHSGRVTCRVAALGSDDPNRVTIGIELVDDGDPEGVPRSVAQYTSAATLIAEIARRWQIPVDREHVVGHRELYDAKRCPGNVDVDRLVAEARELLAAHAHPRVVCLLPTRNADRDVADYLDSVVCFVEGVVALDDGSTDTTAELLATSPLVKILLRNPPRPTYAGWDDGQNRARLLEAVATLEPRWIVWLDADERIDRDDAAALRAFLESDALPGCAYGFEHYRMWGAESCDPDCVVIYRMFAFRPGQRLPDERLHFNPIPTAIAPRAWIPTTIRVQHFGARDEAGRLARLEKYREADPSAEYPVEWGGLADVPAKLVKWEPRGEREVLYQ